MYNKGLFAAWVPKPLMLLLIFIFLIPILSINSVYSNSITDISGALATYTEYMAMASNATTIGMGVAIIFSLRVKMRFRSKEIIVFCSIVLALLSYCIGTTDNPLVVIIAGFFIGFFKTFPFIELLLVMMVILTPTGDRGKFYAMFYPLSICLSQLSAYLMADVVFDGNWQAPYFLMSAVMLVIAALSLIFQHNQRFSFRMPLSQIDWLSLGLLAIAALSLDFALTFMKQQGWFNSPYIIVSILLCLLLIAIVIYRQKGAKRKLVKFELFTARVNIWYSMLLLLLLGIYLATSTLLSQYTVGALGYNNLLNSELNLWMIPGIILAGIYGYISFKHKWLLKYFIASGFLVFFIHCLMMYLLIQPQMNMEYLHFPMFLKGLGMGILYIGIWFYAGSGLNMDELLGIVGVLIIVRTFVATALGAAILNWASYQGQWQTLYDSALYMDIGDFSNGIAMYPASQLNAMLAALKIVFGVLCWISIPVLLLVLLHHFGRFNQRRLVLFRKIVRGNKVRGYYFSRR